MSTTIPNLPPADELHAVREQRKILKDREDVLRQLLISDPSSRTGNLHVAEIKTVTTKRPDIAEMRKIHPDLFDEHTYAVSETRVEIYDIDPTTGEISRTKKRAAA